VKRYALTVRGSHKTWSFTIDADPVHVEDWRADGLEVASGEAVRGATWLLGARARQ